MRKKTGFIGLGIMGRPMAHRLIEAGFSLFINDINQSAVNDLCKEGAVFADLETIGSECDIILTILPSGAIVQDVLFGADGITKKIRPGTLICDMSSVTPVESGKCAEQLKEYGCRFMDSPVSGGEPGAVAGTLTFMAGGSTEDFECMMPYFKAMGTSATLVGPVGSGSVTKLANQIIVNMGIAAVSEALVLAAKAGADPGLVYKAIRGGLAGSTVLEAKAPMMMTRNFKPGGKISINHKDIKNVINTAHELDVPLPLTAQLFEIMQSLKVSGYMDYDHSGIVRYFEQLAGVEVYSETLKGDGK